MDTVHAHTPETLYECTKSTPGTFLTETTQQREPKFSDLSVLTASLSLAASERPASKRAKEARKAARGKARSGHDVDSSYH